MDERIKIGYYKIRNEMATIIIFAAIASFLIKIIGYGYTVEQCMFEFLIMVLSPIYQFIRAKQLGLAFVPSSKKVFSSTAIIAVFTAAIGLFIYIKSRANYGGDAVTSPEGLVFLSFYIAAFIIVRLAFVKYEKHRAKKLEDKYDD